MFYGSQLQLSVLSIRVGRNGLFRCFFVLFHEMEMLMDGYRTISKLAKECNLTIRRIQKLCAEGKLPGAQKFGTIWALPKAVERQKDARVKAGEYRNRRKEGKIGIDYGEDTCDMFKSQCTTT